MEIANATTQNFLMKLVQMYKYEIRETFKPNSNTQGL